MHVGADGECLSSARGRGIDSDQISNARVAVFAPTGCADGANLYVEVGAGRGPLLLHRRLVGSEEAGESASGLVADAVLLARDRDREHT